MLTKENTRRESIVPTKDSSYKIIMSLNVMKEIEVSIKTTAEESPILKVLSNCIINFTQFLERAKGFEHLVKD